MLLIAASAVRLIAFFAILFTKKYPKELFDFSVNVGRWQSNVMAYILLMRDEYPPFSWGSRPVSVSYDVQYPRELSRWMIFVKWLLAIPHLVVLLFLYIGVYLALLVSWFAILFTKRYPEGLFRFVLGVSAGRSG